MSARTSARGRWVVGAALGATALFCGVALHAYTLLGAKWTTSTVSYYVNPVNADVSEAEAEAAVRAGADAWSLQAAANFTFSYAGRTSGSTVSYNGKNEVFFSPEANGGTLATTYFWHSSGRMLDFDIKFWDGGFQFFTGSSGCVSGAYIEDVATHEFGHALGLDHSSVAGATMSPTMSYCSQAWRSLEADDIAGVEFLYPPAGTASTPPVAPTNLGVVRNSSTPTSALNLSWTDNADNEDGFRVERSADGAVFTQIASLPANTTAYTDGGLQAGTTYAYRVRASNQAGFSPYSAVVSATTDAATSSTVPSKPTAGSPRHGAKNVSATTSLSWDSAGATHFDVYFGTSGTPALYASGLTSKTLSLPTLDGGVTYTWRVVAHNTVGSSSGDAWSFTTQAPKGRLKNIRVTATLDE